MASYFSCMHASLESGFQPIPHDDHAITSLGASLRSAIDCFAIQSAAGPPSDFTIRMIRAQPSMQQSDVSSWTDKKPRARIITTPNGREWRCMYDRAELRRYGFDYFGIGGVGRDTATASHYRATIW